MKASILGVAAVVCTMFITSCSSLTPVSEATEYSSRSFVPKPRAIEAQAKIINKHANLDVTPIEINDEAKEFNTFQQDVFSFYPWKNMEKFKKICEEYTNFKNCPTASFGVIIYKD